MSMNRDKKAALAAGVMLLGLIVLLLAIRCVLTAGPASPKEPVTKTKRPTTTTVALSTTTTTVALPTAATTATKGSVTPSKAYCSALRAGYSPFQLIEELGLRDKEAVRKEVDLIYSRVATSCPEQFDTNAQLRSLLREWGIRPTTSPYSSAAVTTTRPVVTTTTTEPWPRQWQLWNTYFVTCENVATRSTATIIVAIHPANPTPHIIDYTMPGVLEFLPETAQWQACGPPEFRFTGSRPGPDATGVNAYGQPLFFVGADANRYQVVYFNG